MRLPTDVRSLKMNGKCKKKNQVLAICVAEEWTERGLLRKNYYFDFFPTVECCHLQAFDPIELLTHLAPQNDPRHLSFVKHIHAVGKKMNRNGRKMAKLRGCLFFEQTRTIANEKGGCWGKNWVLWLFSDCSMLSLASDHYTWIVGVPGQKCFMHAIFSSASKLMTEVLFYFCFCKGGKYPITVTRIFHY